MWLITGNKGQNLKKKHVNLFKRKYHPLLSEKGVGHGN